MKQSLKSNSKINLGLWVKEKREDGFHEIETIFYENENLYDEIEITFKEGASLNIISTFTDNDLNIKIPSEKNLTTKAGNAFLNKVNIKGDCKILIKKNIPTEAGLGGGSSNAATVLKGLNNIFQNKLTDDELLNLAKDLGSDVPFFILGGTCLGRGRGEILKKLKNNLNLEIEIIKPEDISISTKWAYELLDSREFIINQKDKINSIKIALETGDKELLLKNTFNDFEIVVFSYFPELLKIRNHLSNQGFKTINLCGSGSAIFGLK